AQVSDLARPPGGGRHSRGRDPQRVSRLPDGLPRVLRRSILRRRLHAHDGRVAAVRGGVRFPGRSGLAARVDRRTDPREGGVSDRLRSPWAPTGVLLAGCVLIGSISMQREMPLRAPLSTVPDTLLGFAGTDVEIS